MCSMRRDEIISKLHDALPELRRQFGVSAVYLFGSVARGEDRPDSDIDVLVEFDAMTRPTLMTLAGLYGCLTDLFGRPVDVGTLDSLRPHMREAVHAEMLRVA